MKYSSLRLSKKNQSAFTLVELMVVIAIIGILTAIILPSFTTARKQSRVTERVSDMKQVQAALQFYYTVNRSYPSTGGTENWEGACTSYGSYTVNTINNTIPGLAPVYIPAVPIDPQGVGTPNSCYLYTSNGTDYAFIDYNIPEMSSSQSTPNYTTYPELIDPVRGSGAGGAWKVSSPGAVSW